MLVVGLGLGVLGIMLADVIVSLVLLLALASRIRAAVTARFSRAMAREVLRFGLPQLPQALLHQAMAMSDRFILALYLPLEQVGVYLIGTSIASLIKLYPVAFRTAWMPFAFDRMTRPDAPRLFAKLATYAFAVLTFSTLGMVALAESLVTLMTPAEFHAAVTVVPLLALGMAIQTTMNFVGTSVEVSKRTHLYPLATAVGAVIAVGGQFILIPRFGIIGAAVAVGLGQLVLALTLGALAQRAYAIPYEWLRLGKLVAVAVALYALMVTVAPGAGIGVLLVRLGLMAVFPIGLLGLRFFRPPSSRTSGMRWPACRSGSRAADSHGRHRSRQSVERPRPVDHRQPHTRPAAPAAVRRVRLRADLPLYIRSGNERRVRRDLGATRGGWPGGDRRPSPSLVNAPVRQRLGRRRDCAPLPVGAPGRAARPQAGGADRRHRPRMRCEADELPGGSMGILDCADSTAGRARLSHRLLGHPRCLLAA